MLGIAGALSDNDMIQQIDADHFGGCLQLLRNLTVGAARGGIAAGMVVHHDQGAGAEANGLPEDFSGMHGAATRGPFAHFNAANQSVFPIQAERPKVLHF